MEKIITITLNPAFDLHYYMDRFEKNKENYVKDIVCDAGGKGVNISRALTVMGVPNTAYMILGKENGVQFEESLKKDGMCCVPLYVEGRVRENITLHPKDDRETRISLDNFSINKAILDELYSLLKDTVTEGTVVSFSGRIPKGIVKDDVIEFLCRLKSCGARLVVDSNSFGKDDLVKIRPYFIKPNDEEIVAFLGRELESASDAARCACEFVKSGLSEQVMISLGKLGSSWSDGKRCVTVSVPALEQPLSTIGAGDSTVAGFIAATAAKLDTGTILRCAAAFGTAACMTEGTRPPRPEDIAEIYGCVTVSDV